MRGSRRALALTGEQPTIMQQMMEVARLVITPQDQNVFTGNYEQFATDVLGIDLTPKQREIFRSVQNNARTAVKSCHASGKTHGAAALAVAFLHAHARSKVITTGPSWDQVASGMWQYINYFYETAPGRLLGKPTSTRWSIAPNWYAMGIKPADNKPGAIHGYHAPHILIIADEAFETAPAILEALESLMTGGGARLLYLGNPTEVSGPAYEAFHESSSVFNTISIKASDTPNIQAGEIVIPGLIDQGWIDAQIGLHGADSDWVLSRVHAEFPKNQATAWVPIAHVDAAMGRKVRPNENDDLWIGLDIARTGDDKNVLAIRQGEYVHKSESWHLPDLMQSVGKVRGELEPVAQQIATKWNFKRVPKIACLNIDETGMGSGIVDRLKELHDAGEIPFVEHIAGVNFASGSSDREKWPNVRQELWALLRERFREGRIGGNLGKVFVADVTGAKFGYKSGYSAPQVETKETMRSRLGRSPDEADAHALAFYIPPSLRLAMAGSAVPMGVETPQADNPYWVDDGDEWDE